MGISFTLLEKGDLELTLEVDRQISIELGTGFQDNAAKTYSNTGMYIDVADLDTIIESLRRIKKDLQNSWICEHCKTINAEMAPECDTCLRDRHETI